VNLWFALKKIESDAEGYNWWNHTIFRQDNVKQGWNVTQ
jgi:hypothetical protein